MAENSQVKEPAVELQYVQYDNSQEEKYLPAIRALISKDLSEPYSIYVYRYFLHQWGDLCFMALDPKTSALIGVVVCKLEPHQPRLRYFAPTARGYIAMLATSSEYRNQGIATKLVCMAIDRMKTYGADEIVLETEVPNIGARKLYEKLGFLRSKRLWRYYLNGNEAYRLVLYLKDDVGAEGPEGDEMSTLCALPDSKSIPGGDIRPAETSEAPEEIL